MKWPWNAERRRYHLHLALLREQLLVDMCMRELADTETENERVDREFLLLAARVDQLKARWDELRSLQAEAQARLEDLGAELELTELELGGGR